MYKSTSTKKYIISLDKAWSLSKEWKRAAIIWRTLDHIFSIGSFLASISVIYISAANKDDTLVIILSSIAATLTLTTFACNPGKYMSNYRSAFQILNEALVLNTDDSGMINTPDGCEIIQKAIITGEKYIGRTFDVDYMTVIPNGDDVKSDNTLQESTVKTSADSDATKT